MRFYRLTAARENGRECCSSAACSGLIIATQAQSKSVVRRVHMLVSTTRQTRLLLFRLSTGRQRSFKRKAMAPEHMMVATKFAALRKS